MTNAIQDEPLRIGDLEFQSRLLVGTGKYKTFEIMEKALAESGAEIITVAVRRVDFQAEDHLVKHIDTNRYTILPNTAEAAAMAGPLRYISLF